MPWIPTEHEPAIAAMRADPPHAVEAMVDALSSAPADGDDDGTALLAGGPADAAALEADPDLRRRVDRDARRGAAAQGSTGVAADIVSYTVADWGFDPASIGAPTTCVYGADDLLVPPAHGEWWAARIPSAQMEVVDGAGHLVVVPAWPRVIAAARPA